MDNKVSVISIIVKDEESAGRVNELLHEFRQYIVCLLYTSPSPRD